jgi:small GTP-binding protein
MWDALKEDGWQLSRGGVLLPLPVGEIVKDQTDSMVPISRVLNRAKKLLGVCQIQYEVNMVAPPRFCGGDRGPPRAKVKVVLVGDSAVGKTSLVMRYVLDQFNDTYLRTIGAKVTKKEIPISLPDGTPVQVDMSIWDIMGSRSYVDLVRGSYFVGAQGILAVCDVTDEKSLKGLDGWIHGAFHASGEVPVHILANKADLEDQRVLKRSDIKRFSSSFDASFALASAKSGLNVEKVFIDLATRIVMEWENSPLVLTI